jgi:hypothetical protein
MMEIHFFWRDLPFSIFLEKIKWHFSENAESFSAGGEKNGTSEIAFRPKLRNGNYFCFLSSTTHGVFVGQQHVLYLAEPKFHPLHIGAGPIFY